MCHSREGGNPEENLKQFYVYILCSKRNGTLYTGVTSDLVKRVYEHKNDLVKGFTQKYNVHGLVWYEAHESWVLCIPKRKTDKEMEKGMEVETHRGE